MVTNSYSRIPVGDIAVGDISMGGFSLGNMAGTYQRPLTRGLTVDRIAGHSVNGGDQRGA